MERFIRLLTVLAFQSQPPAHLACATNHPQRVSDHRADRRLLTDEPTEKVDTKILETLVELDSGSQLPDGLRVDAFIVPSAGEEAQAQPGRF